MARNFCLYLLPPPSLPCLLFIYFSPPLNLKDLILCFLLSFVHFHFSFSFFCLFEFQFWFESHFALLPYVCVLSRGPSFFSFFFVSLRIKSSFRPSLFFLLLVFFSHAIPFQIHHNIIHCYSFFSSSFSHLTFLLCLFACQSFVGSIRSNSQ